MAVELAPDIKKIENKSYFIPNICRNRESAISSNLVRTRDEIRTIQIQNKEDLQNVELNVMKAPENGTDHSWYLCNRRQSYPNYTLERIQHSKQENRDF